MAEQTQIQPVTMKDPKKIKAGKRLAEHDRWKREEHTELAKTQSESNITQHGTIAVVAIRVLGAIGYYFHQFKTPKETPVTNPRRIRSNSLKTPANKFEMD